MTTPNNLKMSIKDWWYDKKSRRDAGFSSQAIFENQIIEKWSSNGVFIYFIYVTM